MSWIEKLYQTYESNRGRIADPNDPIPLLPLFHTIQNAQLHVVLDGYGNLNTVDTVEKDYARTIIPATEDSAGKAGAKIAPHALCDTLQYVAGDYLDYGGNPTKNKNESGFRPYIEALEGWVLFSGNQKLKSVLTYLKKETLIKDLIARKVLVASEDGQSLALKWAGCDEETPKIFKVIKQANKKGQFEAFVRFSVEIPGALPTELWLDEEIRDSWINYYQTLQSVLGICMVTGTDSNLSSNHPKYIRYPGDGAKLISANDDSGFTYRGQKFTSGLEACSIGIEVTQKAHSALRWLIEHQGRRDGDQAFVAWAVSGADVPDPQIDTLSLLFGGDETVVTASAGYTAAQVAQALSRKIAGYSAKLKATDDVVVIGLDSATPGRMAISYYRELTGSDFLDRLESWHTDCCWLQYFGKDRVFYGAPAPRDVAEVAYGRRIDEKLRKATVERLLPCVIDAVSVPSDLVESCVRRASSRNGIEYWEWEKSLGIACALYRKENQKEGYGMALDEERNSRDYLYGRLLALGEHLEERALFVGGEKRATNAEKLMQRFADHPYTTWRIIETSLTPHKVRLHSRRPGFLHAVQEEIDTVCQRFDAEEFVSDKRLSGEFLLGYHCQRAKLKSGSTQVVAATDDDSEE